MGDIWDKKQTKNYNSHYSACFFHGDHLRGAGPGAAAVRHPPLRYSQTAGIHGVYAAVFHLRPVSDVAGRIIMVGSSIISDVVKNGVGRKKSKKMINKKPWTLKGAREFLDDANGVDAGGIKLDEVIDGKLRAVRMIGNRGKHADVKLINGQWDENWEDYTLEVKGMVVGDSPPAYYQLVVIVRWQDEKTERGSSPSGISSIVLKGSSASSAGS